MTAKRNMKKSQKSKPGKNGKKSKVVELNPEQTADGSVEVPSDEVDADSAVEADIEMTAEEKLIAEHSAAMAELSDRHAAAAAAWAEKEDSLLRLLAERDNQMKRRFRDSEFEQRRFRGEILESLVAVLDDLERALSQEMNGDSASFTEGFQLIATRMLEILNGFGLKPIEALGEKFDPQYHEALMQMEVEDTEKGLVVQEIQKGYLLDDRVLRPSKVAVSR
ncbi:MAG: nucleotide exchange factor GrpE [bacterium]|nr:nucleotide exchange factor GrpE [bacterium]